MLSAAASPPWWGVPVVAGGFAIFGVLVSQFANYFIEHRKDKRRLEADVRAACVRLLVLTKQIEDAKTEDPATSALVVNLANELRLIAPSEIAKAAQSLSMVVLVGQYGATWSEHGFLIKSPGARLRLTNEIRTWLGLGDLTDEW